MKASEQRRSLSGYPNFQSVLKEKILPEKYRELRSYADEHGIKLSDFRDFTGDIDDIKEMIDKIYEVAEDFPKLLDARRNVVLGLHYEDSEEFAGTRNHHITLNGMYLNDTDITKDVYEQKVQQGHFVKNTTWKHIIYHELGHVVCNIYNLDPLQIAKEILDTKSSVEVAAYVAQNLSRYSASSFESMTTHRREYDGTEIISECFCGFYGKSGNKFSELYVKKCKEIIRKEDEVL